MGAGSWSTTSASCAAPTPRSTRSAANASATTPAAGRSGPRRSGKGASWRKGLYRVHHRLLKANERLTERERRRLIALFEREPLIAEAWGLKEAFGVIYRAPDRDEAERGLERFLAAVERAQLPAFSAFAAAVRL